MPAHTILLVGVDRDVRAHLALLDTPVERVDTISAARVHLDERDHDRYIVVLTPDAVRGVYERRLDFWPTMIAAAETVHGSQPGWLYTAAVMLGASQLLELPSALPWLADLARTGFAPDHRAAS